MFIALNRPQGLGRVRVLTPGAPVSLASALVAAGSMKASDTFPVNKFQVQALSTNVSTVYIGAQNMVRSTLAGVIATLSPGGSFSYTNNLGANVYYIDAIYVDADSANDGVFGSGDQN